MDRPWALNSLKFSDKNGELIVHEGHMLTFGNEELAEKYIQKRYKYWQKTLDMDLVIAPSMNETLHEMEVVRVFKLTARFYNMPYRKMMSKSREKELVEARRIAINICKARGVQDAIISRVMDLDHATIVHHKKKFKDLCETEKKLVEIFNDCDDYVTEQLGDYEKPKQDEREDS